jgi:hypothetical protein
LNSQDNLYQSLEKIGLPDEYIEFIRKNINDSMVADGIVNEIEKKRISDTGSFMEFLTRNFRLVPENQNNPVSTGMELSRNLILNGINAYSKILNATVDAVTQMVESGAIPDVKNTDSNVISVKAEEIYNSIPFEDNNKSDKKADDIKENNSEENTDSCEKKVPLSNSEVTHHTASLWKYQPVNEAEPENSTEYKVKTLELSDAKITGASVRGKKHKHDGSNRDDWFDFDIAEDITVMTVSDGAGSKKFSRIGARISCTEAVSCAKKLIEKLSADGIYCKCIKNISSPLNSSEFMEGCSIFADIVQQSVISAHNAVQKAFDERKTKYSYLDVIKRDMSLKDFSATLLTVLAVPVNTCDGKQLFVISCQIGDGMIAVVNRKNPYSDAVKLLGEADGGTFAGETDFLTSENMKRKETLMSRTKIARREISDVLIMTDGVADDYYPNSTQLGRLFTDLQLNGIINISENSEIILDKETEKIRELVPEPVSYPWVNDNSIEVPVNYSSVIEKSCGISSEKLWQNTAVISTALEKLPKSSVSQEEKLKIWLDNYVERGSFDDRTLLIYSVSENDRKKSEVV